MKTLQILQETTTPVTAARNKVQTFENLCELKLCAKQNSSLLLPHSTEANSLKNKNKWLEGHKEELQNIVELHARHKIFKNFLK